jgi:hypothetical protein
MPQVETECSADPKTEILKITARACENFSLKPGLKYMMEARNNGNLIQSLHYDIGEAMIERGYTKVEIVFNDKLIRYILSKPPADQRRETGPILNDPVITSGQEIISVFIDAHDPHDRLLKFKNGEHKAKCTRVCPPCKHKLAQAHTARPNE